VTEQTLKLVVTYNQNENQYSLAAHNQTPEEVQSFPEQWSRHLREGLSFVVLDQMKRHRTEDAKACRACRDTVNRSDRFQPEPKFIRRKE
jgi:hypothetical protein